MLANDSKPELKHSRSIQVKNSISSGNTQQTWISDPELEKNTLKPGI